MESTIFYLNNSKIFTGCAMMIMNIGSKYMSLDLPKSLDNIFQNVWARRIVIFCIAFIATHDIKISLFITLLFILIFRILLNENSKACILPKQYLDFNKDGIISQEEVMKAKQILSEYGKQSKNKTV